jgi:eukaryotic-like serine/threonine-protein kinase
MRTAEARIRRLVLTWVERHRLGNAVSPEDLCRDCPELLEGLKQCIEALDSDRDDTTVSTTSEMGGDVRSMLPVVEGYEILGELGHGGMGVVYRAYDRRRDRVVALKTMRSTGSSDLYRFKNEFRALTDISHPNLVSLYELVSDGRDWFIAMELVDGIDFLSYVRPGSGATGRAGGGGPPGDWQRLRHALKRLADGIVALHEAGRLHCDIKPTNILVTRPGRVVLLDFGLAVVMEASALHEGSEPRIMGTATYMSPEMAAGLAVSWASDWYSVGVLLYEAITGLPPFAGRALDVLIDKQKAEAPAPRELVPGLPKDLDSLCADLLRREPGARPTGAEVLRRLGDAETPIARPWAPPEPARQAPILVGRDAHLAALNDAFREVRRGRAVVVWIHGRSGTGKSALLQRYIDGLIEGDEAVVLSGRCYERESVPYKALDSLVDALSRYLKRLPAAEAMSLLPRDVPSLVRLFPVLSRVSAVATAPWRRAEACDPQESRRRSFGALRELLARFGDRRPLVLALDDLQWGDRDSAALLTEIIRPPESPSLLLLGCYRAEDAEGSPFLREVLRQSADWGPSVDRRELAVGSLSLAEAESLAAALLGRDEPIARAHALEIARESQGIPFFVAELVRHIQADGGAAVRPAAGPGGVSLDRYLTSRIDRLSEAARRLLEVVAVSGRPLPVRDACRAAGLEGDEPKAPAVLRSARLVRGSGPSELEEIETYHDRVREAVVAQLSPIALKEYHGRLAHVLRASRRADAEVLAAHFHEAGDLTTARQLYAEAAEAASRALAFDRAAGLYRMTLDLSPDDPEDQCRLRAKLGDALANAGRGLEAARQYLRGADDSGAVDALELRRRAFQQLLTAGEHDLGIDELRRVFRAVGLRYPETPSRALASAALGLVRLRLRGLDFRPRPADSIADDERLKLDVGWSAGMSLCLIDSARAAEIFIHNLLRGLRAGEPLRAVRPLLAVASLFAVRGSREMGRYEQLLRHAEPWLARLDDPNIHTAYHLVRGLAAYSQGRWPESLEFNDRSTALARDRCVGTTMSLEMAPYYSLRALCWMADIAELRRRRRALLDEAQERQHLFSITNYRTEVMTYDLLADADPDAAAHEIEDAMSRWSQLGFHAQHLFALVASLRVDLYRGRGRAALGRIRDAWPAFRRSQLHRSCIARINLDYLIAAGALASWPDGAGRGRLEREVRSAADRLDRERIDYAGALALMIRGRLAALGDDRARAIRSYSAAADRFRALTMPLHEAATLLRLGECLGPDEGEGLVRRASDWLASQPIRDPEAMSRMILP